MARSQSLTEKGLLGKQSSVNMERIKEGGHRRVQGAFTFPRKGALAGFPLCYGRIILCFLFFQKHYLCAAHHTDSLEDRSGGFFITWLFPSSSSKWKLVKADRILDMDF